MSRNRSIRTLPENNLKFLEHPIPDLYFGEEICEDSDDSDYLLKNILDVGSKSSSSSLSWGEECKTEASNRIKEELERMDRILRGEEPIPDNYDKEEYEEWMEHFPNLSIVGTKTGTMVRRTKKMQLKEEILAIDPICDNNNAKTVINPQNLDISDYLKVTSLDGARRRRQLSSRSLISSQISSSKWLKDEFSSLPFLESPRNSTVAPKSILKKQLVLPPIDTAPHFRSISATPRRDKKSLSALSDQKYCGFKRKVFK